MSGSMSRWWKAAGNGYKKYLTERPFLTNLIQASIFMGSGDFLAQTVEFRASRTSYDLERTAKMTGIGAFFGPALVYYYRYLEKVTGPTTTRTNLRKIIVDQIVVAPMSIIGLIVMTSMVEGKNVSAAIEDKTADLMIDNYKIWPAAQIFNFIVVPPQLRAVFHQVVAVAWNSYVNWKLHNSDEQQLLALQCNNNKKHNPPRDS